MLAVPGIVSAAAVAAAGPGDQAKAQYVRYCASCHGVAGKGDGPVVPALKTRPPNLTKLRDEHGAFSLPAVMAAIDGRRRIDAHGSREMPVWGARFKEALAGKRYPERTTLLTVRALAEYLATIQE